MTRAYTYYPNSICVFPALNRSSMGNMQGFLGKSLLAFVILCCLVRLWRPVVFLHECTRLFKWTVFNEEELLKDYLCHSTIVHPTEYGFPISRSRAYSTIVRSDWLLEVGLDQLFRLHISSALDAGCFFAATAEEAGCLRYRSQHSLSLSLYVSYSLYLSNLTD